MSARPTSVGPHPVGPHPAGPRAALTVRHTDRSQTPCTR